ncbi:MAG: hypothetical protein ACNA8P_12095 [Phycisphaerales bacterium]
MNSINPAEVAGKQKLLIFAILAQIIVIAVAVFRNMGAPEVSPGEIPEVTLAGVVLYLVQLGLAVFTIVAVIMLMASLRRPVVSMVLAAIAMFIPLVSLIVLLCVNARATRVLRESGHRVGLMGAQA